MARKSKKATRATEEPTTDKFSVSSYMLNQIDSQSFPGNIAPEGYFYAPFYEVKLKELDDDLSYANVRRINYDPASATISSGNTDCYDPATGIFSSKTVYNLNITMPVPYKFIMGQPFVIYDVLDDETLRGVIDVIDSNNTLTITTDANLEEKRSEIEKGRFIIAALLENAPLYAEYIPSTERVVWRGLKKMSELNADSPLYNMPFTNGRHYIHQNINVFVRRQDPNNEYHLLYPSIKNPLRRYQIEGNPKLDFDYIQTITDSMVDAC